MSVREIEAEDLKSRIDRGEKPIAEFMSAPSFQPKVPPEFGDDVFVHLPELLNPPSPTVPGAFGTVEWSAIQAFSFLEEARPLFSSSP